jgi:hypothetical protein
MSIKPGSPEIRHTVLVDVHAGKAAGSGMGEVFVNPGNGIDPVPRGLAYGWARMAPWKLTGGGFTSISPAA